MKTFLIQFKWDDPYPKEVSYRVAATSMAPATSRAIKKWKKEHGARVKAVTIKVSALMSTPTQTQ